MKKRSVILQGHHTSVSLEDAYWTELKRIAADKGISVGHLVETIDRGRQQENLSSALRLAVLADLKKRLAAAQAIHEDKAPGFSEALSEP